MREESILQVKIILVMGHFMYKFFFFLICFVLKLLLGILSGTE